MQSPRVGNWGFPVKQNCGKSQLSAGEFFFQHWKYLVGGKSVPGVGMILAGAVIEPAAGFALRHFDAGTAPVGKTFDRAVIRKSCGRFDRNSHLTPLIRQSKAGYENSGGLVRLGID